MGHDRLVRRPDRARLPPVDGSVQPRPEVAGMAAPAASHNQRPGTAPGRRAPTPRRTVPPFRRSRTVSPQRRSPKVRNPSAPSGRIAAAQLGSAAGTAGGTTALARLGLDAERAGLQQSDGEAPRLGLAAHRQPLWRGAPGRMVSTANTGLRGSTSSLVATTTRRVGASPSSRALTYSMASAGDSTGSVWRRVRTACMRPCVAATPRIASCRSSTAVRTGSPRIRARQSASHAPVFAERTPIWCRPPSTRSTRYGPLPISMNFQGFGVVGWCPVHDGLSGGKPWE